jgi:hypothetical protein
VDRIRLWNSLFRALPSELLTKDVIVWIQTDDSDRLVEFLRDGCQVAFDAERAFYDQHAETRNSARVHRPLSDEEASRLESYRDELSQHQERTQLLVQCLRDAKNIAGAAPGTRESDVH